MFLRCNSQILTHDRHGLNSVGLSSCLQAGATLVSARDERRYALNCTALAFFGMMAL
jgi:hypothetical protein